MELLAHEDGWMLLSSLSEEDARPVAPAVWEALAKVHKLSLPGGGVPVLADCRPCNIMVKYVVCSLNCNAGFAMMNVYAILVLSACATSCILALIGTSHWSVHHVH